MADKDKPRLRPVETPEGSAETPSGLVRRAADTMSAQVAASAADAFKDLAKGLIAQVQAGRVTAWALVAAVAILTAGAVAMWWLSRPSDCNPLVVQHVLHQSRVGEDVAQRLLEQGRPEAAEAIRDLTDIDAQPDDVRLCVLIQRSKQ